MAAMKIHDDMAEWNRLREKEGEQPIAVRVAINSGEVVVGEIGSETRVDYTVLGTPSMSRPGSSSPWPPRARS